MQNFKELEMWQKADQITLSIYMVSAKFPKEESYSLPNQLRRVVSFKLSDRRTIAKFIKQY